MQGFQIGDIVEFKEGLPYILKYDIKPEEWADTLLVVTQVDKTDDTLALQDVLGQGDRENIWVEMQAVALLYRKPTKNRFNVGDYVQLNTTTPAYGFGELPAQGLLIGRVAGHDTVRRSLGVGPECVVVVDFLEQRGWVGLESEFELVARGNGNVE